MTKIVNPENLAETFVERFMEFHETGGVSSPSTFTEEQHVAIARGLRQSADNMVVFFHQTHAMVQALLREKYDDEAVVVSGLHQFFTSVTGLLITPVHHLMHENDALIARINHMVAPTEPMDPAEVFGGLDFKMDFDKLDDDQIN